MSYVIDVLSGELPQSYREGLFVRDAVTEIRDAQLGTEVTAKFEPPSDQMRQLHGRLTARYPCITVDPDGPWSDGPLINNFGRHAATVGISYSRVAEVLPFVIATATEMGFWVLDAQDEKAHLPGGQTLRPETGPPPKSRWQFWK